MSAVAVGGITVERDTEDEVATAALPQCQDSTWTTIGCIRGSTCRHIPALLPLIYVIHILTLIMTLTTGGLGMTPLIDFPHEITHLPLGEIPMAPRFEETPMIIILVLYLPLRGEGGAVFHLPHLRPREEGQLSVSVKMVCLIWKSL